MAMQSLTYFAALVYLVAAGSDISLDIENWNLKVTMEQNMTLEINNMTKALTQLSIKVYQNDSKADLDSADLVDYLRDNMISLQDIEVGDDIQVDHKGEPRLRFNLTLVDMANDDSGHTQRAYLVRYKSSGHTPIPLH